MERLAEVIAQAQSAVAENVKPDPEREEFERKMRETNAQRERARRYSEAGFRLPDHVAAALHAGELEATDAMKRVREWYRSPTRSAWLCLSSGAGTGKTVAGADLYCSTYGRWATAGEIVRVFSAMFGEQYELQEKYRNARLLVIDDVGTESDAARMLNVLLELLDARPSAAATPTLITTNLTRKAFAERYANERLMSRLAQLVQWASVSGSDMRRAKK